MIEDLLKAPFPSDAVSWRIGIRKGTKGMLLAYIDARDVMDRLDTVVGAGYWEDAYDETKAGRVICRLWVNYPGIGRVCKSDGAGDTGMEGEKGAISDAFKRAAVKHGIGRYLYSLKSPWVDLDDKGRFESPGLPPEATEKGYKLSISRRIDKESMQQSLCQLVLAFEDDDALRVKEIFGELSTLEQGYLWRLISSKQKDRVRKYLAKEEA